MYSNMYSIVHVYMYFVYSSISIHSVYSSIPFSVQIRALQEENKRMKKSQNRNSVLFSKSYDMGGWVTRR